MSSQQFTRGQKVRVKATGQILTVENYILKMHPPITVRESDRMFDFSEVEPVSEPSPEGDAEFVRVTLSDPVVAQDDEWIYGQFGPDIIRIRTAYPEALTICDITRLANPHAYKIAAQIVREHNAHRKLVEALHDMLACADAGDLDSMANASDEARATLALAEAQL